jgi:hypothetical protein
MLKIIKWMVFILFITVGLPILFFALLFYLAAGGLCNNEIYAELQSPDKRNKAVIFQRDCGATSGFSTQISILPADNTLKNDTGNIFVLKGHPQSYAPAVSWVSNTELFINTPLDGSEIKAELRFDSTENIRIRYAAMANN